MKEHDLFVEHLDDIERAVARVSRRAGWYGTDAEDFRSWVFLRLLEHECRILREHQGRSSVRTYLTVVVTNLMRDFRNRRFGKWRPSRKSVRMGSLAIELDRLLNRDGLTITEAIRTLQRREDCTASEAELLELAGLVPTRPRRTFVALDDVHGLEGGEPADGGLWDAERTASVGRIASELERCLASFEEEDQVILRLKYWNGLSVADVARSLRIPQKPLYRRIQHCLQRLAEALQARGVEAWQVREAVGAGAD